MRPPRGNVSFLFTDIERSSQLWEMHPQTMGRALAQHDDLVRTAVLEHNGYIFKTAGDAFCVAFGSAMNAVRAAADAQHALASAAWEDTGPLRVRMALHSGEAEHRDGDYFGQTLNRVARVLSAGHGGQTLLSRVTAERVREKLPRGISLRDLGERRLKDLSKPERIFQLVAPDLPAEFPPLRSLEVLPNNLPAQVTSFVGRTREMADVKRLLGNTRLLTLTGAGGTGKTRLSLQVAAEVLERFSHGVWLVELATASDPTIVPEAIASVLDVRIERDRAPLDTLIDAVEARNLLIVLDNCEHLIQACAQTASALLRRCPEIRILASSREALNIDGEVILPVPPLITAEFGRVGNDLQLDQLAELEAVQLFVERAGAVKPGFSLTEENAKLLAEICWRLDGIPLAIELAAARVKVLSLEQILTRLDDRFRLLSGGSRTALPRQQTLGALIDWSYDLLSEPERMLLRRLTVFVAGRTLEMAEEVCAGDGLEKAEVFDFLSALVEKSLLMVETGADGESRYTMLESVWDYGDTKLEQSGETARYRRRHLDYFVRFAEAAEPHLFGPEQKTWLERLHVEHYNLNFALRTALGNPDTTADGLRLAGAVGRYWEVRSYLTEGFEQLELLLARADGSIPASVRARAELAAGRLSWSQDRDIDALRHFRAASALYEEIGNIDQVGVVEAFLGFTERNEGNNAGARKHFERAKALGEQVKSKRIELIAENGLGSFAADEGNFAVARTAKEKSLAMAKELGDRWIVSLVSGSLGRLCFAAGDYEATRSYIHDALSIVRELGNKWSVPYAIEGIADVCAEEKEGFKAVRLYGAASALREALALAFSPTETKTYKAALARLHAAVPDAAVFEQEWRAGRALSMEAAIDLALAHEAAEKTPNRRRRQTAA